DVVPVPLRLMALGLPVALSTSVTWPCTAPSFDGAKLRGSATCWPGARVSGNCTCPAPKPSPLTFRDCSTTAAVPLDVNITELAACEPTSTEPKFTEVLLKVRAGVTDVGGGAGASALPVKATDTDG